MDVPDVPKVCSAEVMKISDFEPKPLKPTVLEGLAQDWRDLPGFAELASQHSPVAAWVRKLKMTGKYGKTE